MMFTEVSLRKERKISIIHISLIIISINWV